METPMNKKVALLVLSALAGNASAINLSLTRTSMHKCHHEAFVVYQNGHCFSVTLSNGDVGVVDDFNVNTGEGTAVVFECKGKRKTHSVHFAVGVNTQSLDPYPCSFPTDIPFKK
jgi:hypothetical protein